jgi:hypothetical protein
MTRTLDVYLFADFVGRLVQDDGGSWFSTMPTVG